MEHSHSAFNIPETSRFLRKNPEQPASNRILVHATCGLKNEYQAICSGSSCHYTGKEATTADDGHFVPTKGQILCKRYAICAPLEKSGQSAVLINAKDTLNGMTSVVIKVMHIPYLAVGLKEVDTLRRLNRADPGDASHTVRLLNAFMLGKHVCMVFPSFNPLALTHVVSTRLKLDQKLKVIRKIALHLLSALAFLKRNNTIHADIKSDNILVKFASESKDENIIDSLTLVDFGNAIHHTYAEASLYYSDFELQTLPYRAPEVCLGLPFGVEVDMWSFGCVLAELYFGRILFPGKTKAFVLEAMVQLLGPLPEVMCQRGKFGLDPDIVAAVKVGKAEQRFSPRELMSKQPLLKDYSFASFLCGLLCFSPDKRFTPWQALQHPFMSKEICISNFLQDSPSDPLLLEKADYRYSQKIMPDRKRMCPSTYDLLRSGFTMWPQTTTNVEPPVSLHQNVPIKEENVFPDVVNEELGENTLSAPKMEESLNRTFVIGAVKNVLDKVEKKRKTSADKLKVDYEKKNSMFVVCNVEHGFAKPRMRQVPCSRRKKVLNNTFSVDPPDTLVCKNTISYVDKTKTHQDKKREMSFVHGSCDVNATFVKEQNSRASLGHCRGKIPESRLYSSSLKKDDFSKYVVCENEVLCHDKESVKDDDCNTSEDGNCSSMSETENNVMDYQSVKENNADVEEDFEDNLNINDALGNKELGEKIKYGDLTYDYKDHVNEDEIDSNSEISENQNSEILSEIEDNGLDTESNSDDECGDVSRNCNGNNTDSESGGSKGDGDVVYEETVKVSSTMINENKDTSSEGGNDEANAQSETIVDDVIFFKDEDDDVSSDSMELENDILLFEEETDLISPSIQSCDRAESKEISEKNSFLCRSDSSANKRGNQRNRCENNVLRSSPHISVVEGFNGVNPSHKYKHKQGLDNSLKKGKAISMKSSVVMPVNDFPGCEKSFADNRDDSSTYRQPAESCTSTRIEKVEREGKCGHSFTLHVKHVHRHNSKSQDLQSVNIEWNSDNAYLPKRKCCVGVSYGEKLLNMYGQAVSNRKRKYRKDKIEMDTRQTIVGSGDQSNFRKNNNKKAGNSLTLKSAKSMINSVDYKDGIETKIEDMRNDRKCYNNNNNTRQNEMSHQLSDKQRKKIGLGLQTVEEKNLHQTLGRLGKRKGLPLEEKQMTKKVRRALEFSTKSNDQMLPASNYNNISSSEGKTMCEGEPHTCVTQAKGLNSGRRLLRLSTLKGETQKVIADPYDFQVTPDIKRLSSNVGGNSGKKQSRTIQGLSKTEKLISNTMSIGELVEKQGICVDIKCQVPQSGN